MESFSNRTDAFIYCNKEFKDGLEMVCKEFSVQFATGWGETENFPSGMVPETPDHRDGLRGGERSLQDSGVAQQ